MSGDKRTNMNLVHNGTRNYSEGSILKIFSHSILFGMQTILPCLPGAIYFQLFVYLEILKPDEQARVTDLVGWLVAGMYLGKLISDPLWGILRDKIGDKLSIIICTFLNFVSTVLFTMCRNMV